MGIEKGFFMIYNIVRGVFILELIISGERFLIFSPDYY